MFTLPELSRFEPRMECTPLAEEASRVLGYSRLKQATVGGKLAEVLAEAGVRPFDSAQVEAYKRHRRLYGDGKTLKACAAVFAGICLLATVLGVLADGWWLMGLLLCVPVVAYAVCYICGGAEDWDWKSENIGSYEEEVPEYALKTAIDVANALKSVLPENSTRGCLYIEFLDRRLSIARHDPFLYVQFNGQRAYLEVWDEPGFFHKRTV